MNASEFYVFQGYSVFGERLITVNRQLLIPFLKGYIALTAPKRTD